MYTPVSRSAAGWVTTEISSRIKIVQVSNMLMVRCKWIMLISKIQPKSSTVLFLITPKTKGKPDIQPSPRHRTAEKNSTSMCLLFMKRHLSKIIAASDSCILLMTRTAANASSPLLLALTNSRAATSCRQQSLISWTTKLSSKRSDSNARLSSSDEKDKVLRTPTTMKLSCLGNPRHISILSSQITPWSSTDQPNL